MCQTLKKRGGETEAEHLVGTSSSYFAWISVPQQSILSVAVTSCLLRIATWCA